VTRRGFLTAWAALPLAGAETSAQRLAGQLRAGANPSLRTETGEAVRLTGDTSTMQVLDDARLNNMRIEVSGRLEGPGVLRIDPFHTRALRVVRGGERLFVTYWCDLCAIRTYVPGKCMCCQDETALDLRGSLEP
jgi:hypothetical protein